MKTVTGLFDSYRDADLAVRDLEDAGVPSDDISIISHSEEATSAAAEGAGAGAGIGAIAGGTGGLAPVSGKLAIPGVGPVVAAGWLIATAAGAAAGAAIGGAAGGIVGALIPAGVPEGDANIYAEGLRRGGALVTVRTDDSKAPDVEAILMRNKWVDIADRRRAYAEAGWERFDEKQPPYSADEIYRRTPPISDTWHEVII